MLRGVVGAAGVGGVGDEDGFGVAVYEGLQSLCVALPVLVTLHGEEKVEGKRHEEEERRGGREERREKGEQ